MLLNYKLLNIQLRQKCLILFFRTLNQWVFFFKIFFSVLYFSCHIYLTPLPARCREHCMPVEEGKSVQFSNNVRVYLREHQSWWSRMNIPLPPCRSAVILPIIFNRRSWVSSSFPPYPTAGRSCLLTLPRIGSSYHVFQHSGGYISFEMG